MSVRHFDRPGLMAIDPRAFGVVVSEVKVPERKVERIGDAAVVSIVGPLEHHAGEGYCDSYEAILSRVTEACESDASAVVLKVDSPGGLVSGCFGTAHAVRAKCEAAGKRLLAFVSGSASSAAYALVSQAERLVIGVGSTVGSVGIIDVRVDATRQAAAMGLRFAFLTSGERKADGNPHLPISEEELAARQETVDAMADVFFDLVATRRPITAAKIKALEARVFTGQAAVENGLADAVGTFDDLLAFSGDQPQVENTMGMREALEEAAKGDGDEAKAAKRALAAWDDKEEAKAEESDEKKDDEEEAKAEDDEEKKDDEKKEEAKASAPSASSAGNDRLSAIEATQRSMLIDARPDLTKEQRAFAAGLSLDKVQGYLGTIAKAPKPKHAASATPAATRAEGQDSNGSVSHLPPDQKAILDAQMGLSAITYTGVENTPLKVVLGAPVPVKREAKAG